MQKINYNELNGRQQEIYNFQKLSAILAEYGFQTIQLSDDWQGADFIALHFDKSKFLKIQLKGRLTFDKKYLEKDIKICFQYKGFWYLYDHDELLKLFISEFNLGNTTSWNEGGNYNIGSPSQKQLMLLEKYRL